MRDSGRFAERIRESGVKCTGAAVIDANVSEALIHLAPPERVGLLVLATHGRGGLKRLMLGSVADKLVRGVNVPVLVIRPKVRRQPTPLHHKPRRAMSSAGH